MRSLLLLLALALAPRAAAQASMDALGPGARRFYEEGRRFEEAGQFEDAAAAYRSLLRVEPDWNQAALDLGRVLEAMEDFEAAESVYADHPYDQSAVVALARLWLATDRPERVLAPEFRAKLLNWSEDPEPMLIVADAAARVDPRGGRDMLLQYLDAPTGRLGTDDALRVAARVCRALWELEREEGSFGDEAHGLLDRIVEQLDSERVPSEDGLRDALVELEERFAVEEEAGRLARAADRPLDEAGRLSLKGAQRALAEGRVDEALGALETLTRQAPSSAVAWGALSDAALAEGDVQLAERATLVAEQLDPMDPSHAARLGDILFRHYGGRFDREAAEAYARAVARPTANPELWYRKARAERAAGMPEAAAESMARYLASEPEGPRADEARRFVAGGSWSRATPPEPPPLPRLPEAVGEVQWQRYWIAVVLARKGRSEEALTELEPVLAEAPQWVEGKNLRAAIALRQGATDQALALYQESLALDRTQGDVMLVLADLHRDAGDASAAMLLEQEAASLGEPLAHLRLGLRDEAGWDYLSARGHLSAYLAWNRRDPGEARDRAAVEAAARIERRLRGGALAALALLGLVIGLPVAARQRKRSGKGLCALLEGSPAAWPDVARILSAIRHEVLKHHTTVLGSVATELEVGDPDLGVWAADRLGGKRGAIARYRGYVDELERMGRAHGVALNLRHRDPTFQALTAAMDRLEAMLDDLREGRPQVADRLREVAEDLNLTGYRNLGGVLRRLCLLPLDRPLFEEVWSGVAAELRQDPGLELDLPDDRVLVRIFRREMDDILTNLLRNALEAAAEGREPRVGVRIAMDEDPITGIERVEIRVRDNASRRISTAMIRGRYIGRGLGLAVDLISRNGGSIHVEDEPGWAKAVVVRLPRAEAPDLEDE